MYAALFGKPCHEVVRGITAIFSSAELTDASSSYRSSIYSTACYPLEESVPISTMSVVANSPCISGMWEMRRICGNLDSCVRWP